MIVKKRRTWLKMLFALHGTSLTRTLPRVWFITAFSFVITLFEVWFEINTYSLTVAPFALTALCRTIEVNFRQQLDESPVAELLKPVNDVLIW